MERMRKQGGLLAALAALPEFLLRRRLERSRAEALKALIGRNDNHLLDDIGMGDIDRPAAFPPTTNRKPWMLRTAQPFSRS